MRSSGIKVGDIFEDLTVIEFSGYGMNSRPMWKCLCSCGKERITHARYLQRGSVKDCGCKYDSKKSHGKHHLESGVSLRNRVAESYKNNAKKKNILFNLSKEIMFTMFQANCHFCGRAPYHTISNDRSYGTFTYNGIDRLTPELGYTEDNIVTCCQQCNYMKNSYTKEEFLHLISLIYLNYYTPQ